MRARVEEIIGAVIRREGGYVNNPVDRGGPTNMGITLPVLSDYLGRKATSDEIKNLKPEIAQEIYYRRYFLLPRVDALPEAIQPIMLDMCVHHGVKKAMKVLQCVINKSGLAHVIEDGVCGPNTQHAARHTHEEMGSYFINALVDERINIYRQIVGSNPSQLIFLRGWERRAESFRVTA